MTRRFGILDAMILVAFSGLGLAWCKLSEIPFWAPLSTSPLDMEYVVLTFGRFLTFCLIAGTLAFALLRIRQPRPRMRRLLRSPASAACLTVLVAGTVRFLARLIPWILQRVVAGIPPGYGNYGLGSLAFDRAIDIEMLAGPAIMATWTVLAVIRRIRLQRDWVEVLGLILAAGWIALVFKDLIGLL